MDGSFVKLKTNACETIISTGLFSRSLFDDLYWGRPDSRGEKRRQMRQMIKFGAEKPDGAVGQRQRTRNVEQQSSGRARKALRLQSEIFVSRDRVLL